MRSTSISRRRSRSRQIRKPWWIAWPRNFSRERFRRHCARRPWTWWNGGRLTPATAGCRGHLPDRFLAGIRTAALKLRSRSMNQLSRRRFLQATAAGMAAAPLPLTGLSQMVAPAGSFSDYRALVCVFLFGGNDSFNMLVPRSGAEYNVYAGRGRTLRSTGTTCCRLRHTRRTGPTMACIRTCRSYRRCSIALVSPSSPTSAP